MPTPSLYLPNHQFAATNEHLVPIFIEATHTHDVGSEFGDEVHTFKCPQLTILADELHFHTPFELSFGVIAEPDCSLHACVQINECHTRSVIGRHGVENTYLGAQLTSDFLSCTNTFSLQISTTFCTSPPAISDASSSWAMKAC
jgi:hypothetical protein